MPGAARTLNDSFQLTFQIGILENLPQSTCRHFLRLVATNWDEVVEIRVDVLVVAFPFFSYPTVSFEEPVQFFAVIYKLKVLRCLRRSENLTISKNVLFRTMQNVTYLF